eukprot:3718840-Pyramimonas_sp.AAC.1
MTMRPSWASWTDRSVIRGFLGPFWAPLGLQEVMREHSGGPRGRAGSLKRFESLVSGPITNPQA